MRARGRQASIKVSATNNGSWRWGSVRMALQNDGKKDNGYYPQFSTYTEIQDIKQMYDEIASWGNRLTDSLQIRDDLENSRPSFKVLQVTTVTDLGNPQEGDAAFL